MSEWRRKLNEGTRVAALDYFGIKARHPRQGWSFESKDKTPPVIVVSIFSIHLKEDVVKGIYFDGFDRYHEDLLKECSKLIGKPSNKERIELLKKAIFLSDELVRVIKVIPKRPMKEILKSYKFYPIKNRWFKVTRLDLKTGQFRLEVGPEDEV